jgi:hypothetical protein
LLEALLHRRYGLATGGQVQASDQTIRSIQNSQLSGYRANVDTEIGLHSFSLIYPLN